jgi:alcohol dehydrogenase (cytochrome c)
MTLPRFVTAGALLGALALALPHTVPSGLRASKQTPYAPVTDERLRDPEPDNWLMYRRTYNGWGYSPLHQIRSQNVVDLKPAWVFATGVYGEHHQAPPIVNDGTMFVTTGAQVIALDAERGALLWRYVRELPQDLRRPHSTNRGVGLYDDKVYVGTLDAHVVALDARSGRVVWDQAVEDYQLGYYITMAPLVANGKVMVGTSGGEQGIRGSVTALDAGNGDEVWKRFTIPAPEDPGGDTWPGESWRTGGGPVWLTGTYDPQLNVTYWGVGNPGPWMGDARPGDNLFTNSTIALDADTGELRGHHQYHWNGSWDWDEANAPLLVDITRGGRTIPALVHAGRNGYLWFLARHPHGLSFIEGKPYVYQNVFTNLDPFTGRPTYDPDHVPGTGKRTQFCPSLAGARNWPPEAYSPQTGYLYIPATENRCSFMEGHEVEYTTGQDFTGAEFEVFTRDEANHTGELQAWDLDTGDQVWSRELASGDNGAVLTTGGGLVFLGGRDFRAFHAWSGSLLWQIRTNYGRTGVPTSYEVKGTQYIAVQSGAEPLPGSGVGPPQDGLVWAFALDCQCY